MLCCPNTLQAVQTYRLAALCSASGLQGHFSHGIMIVGQVVEAAWSLDSQLLALVVAPNVQNGCDDKQPWKVQVGNSPCAQEHSP